MTPIEDRAGGPATALMTSGIFGLVFNILYGIWSGVPLLMGVFVVGASINDQGLKDDTLMSAVVFTAVPIAQLLMFVFCVALSALTLWGGIRFNHFQSKGLVYVALAASTANPLIGVVANSASGFSCGTLGLGLVTGCVFANMGSLLFLILGMFATIWGIVYLTGPEGERFES